MNSLVHRVGTNTIMLKMIMVIVMMYKVQRPSEKTSHKNTKVIMVFEFSHTNAYSL